MKCYVCHKELTDESTHSFYKRMCIDCGDLNFSKRNELGSLFNHIALVTGGRIKIGFHIALKLLRSGASVIVTTRFPVDAVKRYSNEKDFDSWKDHLLIYKIDFRQIPSIYSLIEFIEQNFNHLDILINNAAQTIKRPYQYYHSLEEGEQNEFELLPEGLKKLICKQSSTCNFKLLQLSIDNFNQSNNSISASNRMFAYSSNFPLGKYDEDGLQLDNSPKNSWVTKAEDVSLMEMLEVQLINVTAPFVLATSLKKAMEKSPNKYKHIINVSAMEGQFSKRNKNAFHPHTNMAKASLNMFTRTSAQDFIQSGIIMNSVDTGWVTDENPEWLRKKNRQKGYTPPIDSLDGAARVCDPILSFSEDRIIHGKFLKDYQQINW